MQPQKERPTTIAQKRDMASPVPDELRGYNETTTFVGRLDYHFLRAI